MAYTRINWQDLPNTTTPRNATNLNKMDAAIKEHDDALNVLSYEKGTWEPIYINCTYTHYQYYQAHYVKIGKMVILIFHDRPTITPSGTKKARIGGLPFTPAWPQLGSGSLGTCMVTNTTSIPSVTFVNDGYLELCSTDDGSQLVEWKTTTGNSSWIDGFAIYWCQ